MHNCEHYIESIYYQLEQTARYCRYLGSQIFQKLDMPVSMDEFVTMDTISLNDGMCQRELAKLILKDRANTGRILNSLEEKGYIERFVDTKNNRLVRKMRLTPEGREITTKVSKVLREYIEKLPKVLSENDKFEIMESLKRFREGLEQEVEMKI
ncbi:MAG: hypothetical protein DK841_09220 [Candidatus Melainabacteria bacterium]|jgi:transcriptional regulator, MarR family|nr:MAG: hypothetical protein DK841_09220 [Candidatus Melainabacteria bacterium]